MRPFDLNNIECDSQYSIPSEKKNKRKSNRKKEKLEKKVNNRTSTRMTTSKPNTMLNTVCDIDSKYVSQNGVGQKRKRKTERELRILRQELRKNVMWTRESIKKMRIKYESEFFMTEQQIYKWWWDQTRKRSKKVARKVKGSSNFHETYKEN